ncbi:unnamed protein product [Closterium sp. Naga37s-1]|nr:unnamed protein product [Closterium sp. Naga37s-1]
MDVLEKELRGKDSARLALKAFAAAPEEWKTLLIPNGTAGGGGEKEAVTAVTAGGCRGATASIFRIVSHGAPFFPAAHFRRYPALRSAFVRRSVSRSDGAAGSGAATGDFAINNPSEADLGQSETEAVFRSAGSSAEAADAVAAVAAVDVASAATDAATDVAAHAAESAADEASDEENDFDKAKEARKKALKDGELVWHKCVQSEKLGEVCVGVFVDSQQEPPLLFAEISLRNHTFLAPLAKAKACLDDQLLLNLLLHDPKLAPFAAEIKAIMIMEKLAAADVISECVLFNGLSITVDKPNDCLYISACPRLCSRLGCRHAQCLYSKDKEFECFRVRVPLHRRSRDVAVR